MRKRQRRLSREERGEGIERVFFNQIGSSYFSDSVDHCRLYRWPRIA